MFRNRERERERERVINLHKALPSNLFEDFDLMYTKPQDKQLS